MLRIFVLGLALILGPAAGFGQAPAPPVNSSDQISAKTWLQNRAEIEEYLRTAKVIGEEDIPIGVTKPKRMRLEPGGPVEYFAFKAIQPGRHQGFFESYKFEIAAYELDKLLGLDMVPPTVERRIKGVEGAAVMWCSPTKSFKDMGGAPPLTSIPGRHVAQWVRQMARAKLFDNLVGNIDANQGNWLVDPAWNLILIDKTRAFGTDGQLPRKDITHIDLSMWERMQALTEEALAQSIGKWAGKGEIRAMLERRKKMQVIIDKLMAEKKDGTIFR